MGRQLLIGAAGVIDIRRVSGSGHGRFHSPAPLIPRTSSSHSWGDTSGGPWFPRRLDGVYSPCRPASPFISADQRRRIGQAAREAIWVYAPGQGVLGAYTPVAAARYSISGKRCTPWLSGRRCRYETPSARAIALITSPLQRMPPAAGRSSLFRMPSSRRRRSTDDMASSDWYPHIVTNSLRAPSSAPQARRWRLYPPLHAQSPKRWQRNYGRGDLHRDGLS